MAVLKYKILFEFRTVRVHIDQSVKFSGSDDNDITMLLISLSSLPENLTHPKICNSLELSNKDGVKISQVRKVRSAFIKQYIEVK